MQSHLFKSHGLEEIKISRNKYVIRTPKKTVCNECQKELPNMQKLESHIKYKHRRTKCLECPAMLLEFDIKRHKLDAHGIGEEYTCGVCGYKNLHKHRVDCHQRKVHMMEKNVKCTHCDQMFFNEVYLKRHMISHNPTKSYECTYCKKKFARLKTLRVHKAIHTGDKKKACHLCGEKFVQKASLNYHMVKHHPGAC